MCFHLFYEQAEKKQVVPYFGEKIYLRLLIKAKKKSLTINSFHRAHDERHRSPIRSADLDRLRVRNNEVRCSLMLVAR